MKSLLPLLLAMPLLASCQVFGGDTAEAQAQTEVVPYHLAIVVESTAEQRAADEWSEERRAAHRAELEELGRRLQEGLAPRFTKVSVIQLADEERQIDSAFANPYAHLELYVPKAKALGADVLLQAELNPAGMDHKRRGDLMAANVLLFLIGGPLSWWLGDNEYSTQTNIVARYWDVNRLELRPNSEGCECQEYTARSDAMTLSFEDRMENWGNWGYRALSVVVPASFLGKDSEEAVAMTQEGARLSLVQSMVSQVDAGEMLSRRERHPFLHDSSLVLSADSDEARLELVIDISRITSSDGYDARDLSAGRYVVQEGEEGRSFVAFEDVAFEEVEGAAGEGRQFFVANFPSSHVTEPGATLQVRLETDNVTESWTFGLSPEIGPLDLGTP